MRILVVGSGGREHALCWRIAQSSLVDKVFCAPGNGGISQIAECVDIKSEDISSLLDFARKENIALTVVGPELPLSLGIVDEFLKYNLKIFGPTKKAAKIESSKIFSKELMLKYNIPTASFCVFDDPQEAKVYIDKINTPCVLKADGLAAGKGVVVAKDIEEAKRAVTLLMEDRVLGDSAKKIIIEECLYGQEASIIVITDSKDTVALASSQDHKRVFDEDLGPNTGGMGAYSPANIVTPDLFNEIVSRIVNPTISALNKEGIEYRGVLYAGVMLTGSGPKVLEFNARFGDPETQAIIPRLKSDLVEVMLAVCEGKLSRVKDLVWDNQYCVCVVLASKGYPGNYEKDKVIFGLDDASKIKDAIVFHSGTKVKKIYDVGQKQELEYLTSGGRVLGVCGLDSSIRGAISKAYQAVSGIGFEGVHYRKDIGFKALGL